MAGRSAVIRLQPVGGQWETVGVDRQAGIYAEDLEMTSNEWGNDTCRFTLKRDSSVAFPDIRAFSAIEIEVGGLLVWTGFIWQTPTRDGKDESITVEGRGWQYHLDDDVYNKKYVHTRLTDWQDSRTFPTERLDLFWTGGTVTTEQGAITLGMSNGTTAPASACVGVFLDLGIGNSASNVSFDWVSSNNTAAISLYCRGTNLGMFDGSGGFTDAAAIPLNTAASGTNNAAFGGNSYRYIHFVVFFAAGGALGADYYMKLNGIRLFSSASYVSGSASVLKADTIIKDARDQATIRLSSSNSKISAGSFSIPEFALEGQKSAREAIIAANAFHSWQTKVNVDKELVFAAQPSTPKYSVGKWGGLEFEDASANAAEEIYNRVIVEGTGPDGQALSVYVTASEIASSESLELSSDPIPTNDSFTTNNTSWSASGSFITRDTSVFDTTPASGLWDNAGTPPSVTGMDNGDTVTETFTGTFLQGKTYLLKFRMRRVNTPSSLSSINGVNLDFGLIGTDSAHAEFRGTYFPSDTWVDVQVVWTPSADRTGVTMRLTAVISGALFSTAYRIDTLKLYKSTSTIIDNQGFRRTKVLPIDSALTTAVGAQIGQTYLTNHQTTPFKGTATVTGNKAVREYLGTLGVPPATLLLNTNELVNFSHLYDPDTGNMGREGRIASVTYNHKEEKAVISIDDTRFNFESLMSRLAVLTSQVR